MLVMCSVKEDINFDKTPDSENELFVVCAWNGIKLSVVSFFVCFYFLVCFSVHRFPIQRCEHLPTQPDGEVGKKGNSTLRGTKEMYDGQNILLVLMTSTIWVVVRLFFRRSIQKLFYWFKQLLQTLYTNMYI